MTQPDVEETVEEFEEIPAGEGSLPAAETAIAALVLAMYASWLTSVFAAVMAPFTFYGLAPDPTAIWSTVPLWNRQVDRLMTALEQLTRAGWIDATTQLGVDAPFNPSDAFIQDQLARTRNLMVRTPDDVYQQIIRQLAEGVAAGETVQQQAARVRHILDVTGTENWPARAKTVAVTEVHRAYNFGGLAAAFRAQEQINRRIRKRWVSRDDRATRSAHVRADGQLRATSQPFRVGGESLMAPGDPSGSPWNVINCRCVVRYSRGG